MNTAREFISTWWPIALPLLAIAGSTVRAEAQNSHQSQQLEVLRAEGVPHTNERLARIETRMDIQDRTLQRIESKLDRSGAGGDDR